MSALLRNVVSFTYGECAEGNSLLLEVQQGAQDSSDALPP
jgi:hypothetical protein